MAIRLGDVAKDSISGFTGTVIAETNWLYGCKRMTLQPDKLHDGKPIESHTFDEPQLVLVSRAGAVKEVKTGGPRPEPSRSSAPK